MLKTSIAVYNDNVRSEVMIPTFHVIIHPAEEGGYWAECTEIKGAITQGDTLHETEKNIFEAIDLMLEDDYPEIIDYMLEFEVRNA